MRTRLFVLILMFCGIINTTRAQKITRSYRNVSLSKALEDLGKSTQNYTINFIYNELEDFTVTVDIRNSTLPDAVRAVCGMYPMKIKFYKDRIYVECTQKADRKYTGKVVDSRNQPVVYANVALLSPKDSSFVNGGVSNANGDFVIPCALREILVKVSCIGYRTIYRMATAENIGTLKLADESYRIKGVVVKGERPQYKMTDGGLTVDVEHSLLSQMGTACDVLSQLPRVKVSDDGNVSVFAKGTPIIYINNKPVRDKGELQRLKSTDIKSVDVITSPGARYDAAVESVIRIKTLRTQGDGFSFRTNTYVKYNKKWAGHDELLLKYRSKGWEAFADLYYYSISWTEDNNLWQDIYVGKNHINVDEKTLTKMRMKGVKGNFGLSYDINEYNSFGMSYSVNKSLYGKAMTENAEINVLRNGKPENKFSVNFDRRNSEGPGHELNVYYIGKLGEVTLDFNATYVFNKSMVKVHNAERGEDFDNRDIFYRTKGHNKMLAGKFVVGCPVGKGTLRMGSEVSHTNAVGSYEINIDYVSPSETDVSENNIAGFTEIQIPFGRFSLSAGLRFEHVTADYYSFGVWQEAPSRRYNNLFPNLSVSWNKGKWGIQLNYVSKTARPSYNSLRNEKQYDNQYMYEGGNPYLRPCIKHNFEFDVTHSWFNISTGYTYIKNVIEWMCMLYQNKEIAFLHNMNFNHSQYLYASVGISPKFGKYEPTLELDYWQQIFDARKYGSSRTMYKPEFGFVLRNRFVFSPSCFAMLNVSYNTENCNGFRLNQSAGSLDVGLVKSFLNKALVFSINAADLLKTRHERWIMYGQSVDIGKNCYNYVRNVSLTVTYNFNASRSKYKGTGAGNEEKKRL
ncbi:TonB-dependent receptor domain-containing protein [Prevotella sp. OH937_COT-195]|uniref:TonB-dependent receptor domain-containing protein n=1 Tax=Prevotella sp. OH937_COT-195 TaxID=2491051 RepID=UPI000F645F8B|nr:TonB-dependent receptor [Prevotella sp. OH937_COT-195]RRD02919.1 TonB-dependent receptor [Prevotella sp. OH937_COT-195]